MAVNLKVNGVTLEIADDYTVEEVRTILGDASEDVDTLAELRSQVEGGLVLIVLDRVETVVIEPNYTPVLG